MTNVEVDPQTGAGAGCYLADTCVHADDCPFRHNCGEPAGWTPQIGPLFCAEAYTTRPREGAVGLVVGWRGVRPVVAWDGELGEVASTTPPDRNALYWLAATRGEAETRLRDALWSFCPDGHGRMAKVDDVWACQTPGCSNDATVMPDR